MSDIVCPIRYISCSFLFLFFVVEEVAAILKALVLYFFEDNARDLQGQFVVLLELFETHMKEIWKPRDVTDQATTFGSDATVHSIIEKRKAATMLPSVANGKIPLNYFW